MQLLELVHPAAQALGGLIGTGGGHAKALQVDQAAHPFGANAGILHGHPATHAVADQVHRLVRGVVVQQKIQVG